MRGDCSIHPRALRSSTRACSGSMASDSTRVHCGARRSRCCLLEVDVADIDGDHDMIAQHVAVAISAVGPALGGQFDAVRFDDVVEVLGSRKTPSHVDAIVVAAHQVVISEVELLSDTMTRDVGGKTCL